MSAVGYELTLRRDPASVPFWLGSGLNHCTGTTTAFIRKADIRVRFALSAHQISN